MKKILKIQPHPLLRQNHLTDNLKNGEPEVIIVHFQNRGKVLKTN